MLYLQPFLNTGVTTAVFHAAGNSLSVSDVLNSLVMMDEAAPLDSRSMRPEILSEPMEPERGAEFRACSTSAVFTGIKSKPHCAGAGMEVQSCESLCSGTAVLTEEMKCSFNEFADILLIAGVLQGQGDVDALVLPRPEQIFT